MSTSLFSTGYFALQGYNRLGLAKNCIRVARPSKNMIKVHITRTIEKLSLCISQYLMEKIRKSKRDTGSMILTPYKPSTQLPAISKITPANPSHR